LYVFSDYLIPHYLQGQPWEYVFRRYHRSFSGIYHGYRSGEFQPQPWLWVRALSILATCLLFAGIYFSLTGR